MTARENDSHATRGAAESIVAGADCVLAVASKACGAIKKANVPMHTREVARKAVASMRTTCLEDVIDTIDQKDPRCVSFDVFDTLVVRAVDRPEDVFRKMEKEFLDRYRIPMPFEKMRITAADSAQKHAGRRQATLAEVYDHMPSLTPGQKTWAMEREVELEILLCAPVPETQKAWRWCMERGLDIVVASDTFLPQAAIETILTRCGYAGWKKLYVSSSVGHRKATGDLFGLIAEDMKREGIADTRSLCHIGDSLKADYRSPREFGIEAILVPRGRRTDYRNAGMRRWSTEYEAFEYSIVNRFVASRMPREYDYFERIGYEALGPILFGFSKWLEHEAGVDGIRKCFFLTREGELLKRAYEAYAGDTCKLDVELLHVSRQATSTPLLEACESLDDISVATRIPRVGVNISEAMLAWGLSDADVDNALASAQLSRKSNVHELTEREKTRLFDEIRPRIATIVDKQRRTINAYLNEKGFVGDVGVVDVGWFGTIQSNLQALRPDANVCGYYVAKKKNYGGTRRPLHQRFFLSDSMYSPVGEKLASAVEVFELLFLSNEGTTLGYDVNDDGSIVPRLGAPERTGENARAIHALQDAALRFVEDFKPFCEKLGLRMAANTCSAAYCRFIDPPSKEMIEQFSAFTVIDTGTDANPLFATNSLAYYAMHPRQFTEDFKGPGSKGIFLKSVFKVPLPWPHILTVMRRFEGQVD